MNKNLRKSDTLAHTTGSFINILKDVNNVWDEKTQKIISLSPDVFRDVKEVISSKGKNVTKKEEIIANLTTLCTLYNEMEQVSAERIDLMIEMEGLDFPIKTPKKLLDLSKRDVEMNKLLKTIAHNISKTMTFIDQNITDVELLENSLKSFESTFTDYNEIIDISRFLTANLEKELEKEFQKARKYGDMV
ncbi:MAG: hypothetical protein E3J43_03420 [Candidatus Heimdallarchaeota archaeon]|nr:MAG: hypothetical protein E3J43_03420 [Candidatus Heimdallarchaeota archaeon]